MWLESWLTKDEILERYLSNAYFGDNQYGLRAASLHYFYRQPEKLRPEQAAMLAGLLQAPSRYAPTKHYDKAKKRMELVIQSMVDVGYLTAAEAAALPDPRVDVRKRDDNLPTGTYFADWALPLAREGMDASYSQQVLTTTLDSRLQTLANRIVARAPLGGAQVALVAMRRNGEVVAMVGGRDYGKSPFNRVTQARRQPGSTFKTIVYLTALEAGWEPDDTIPNTPITQGSYRPKNSREQYSDQITLENAFAQSSNVAAVRLFQAVGSDKVIRTARKLGITAPMTEGDPSLALGTSSMTLMELTAAYAGIAANDYPIEPHAFARGEQGWWEWLTTPKDSMSSDTHEDLEGMLRAAINRGTGRNAVLPVANFGKTGTTQDYRDALFVGYAGDLVVGVWVGNDDNTPLNGVTGGSTPARIWRDFMRGALKIEAAPSAPSVRHARSRRAGAAARRAGGRGNPLGSGRHQPADRGGRRHHPARRRAGGSPVERGRGGGAALGVAFAGSATALDHQDIHHRRRNRAGTVILPRLDGDIGIAPPQPCDAADRETGPGFARSEVLHGDVDRLQLWITPCRQQRCTERSIARRLQQPGGCPAVEMLRAAFNHRPEIDREDRHSALGLARRHDPQ